MTKTKADQIVLEGMVEEELRGGKFRVRLENDHEVFGHVSGKLRRHRIRVLPGDRIQIELSAYDLTRGRITYRFG